MQCYGLAAAGQAGIVRMLEIMEDEVTRALGLLGVTSYGKLDRSYVAPRRRPMRRTCSRLSRCGNTRRIGTDTSLPLVAAKRRTRHPWLPRARDYGADSSLRSAPNDYE